MKRILLIDPPGLIESFNAGIGYIAGTLKKKGYEVKALDFNNDKTNQDIRLEQALREGFNVIGLSIKSNTVAPSVKIAEKCRTIRNDILIVAGGPEVTVEGARFLDENPVFDYAFLGEAEESILQFLRFMEGDATVDSVNGLCYRKDGKVMTNHSHVPQDLDTIPFPDYYVFDTFGKRNLSYPLVTSRGCPYDCTYCCVKIISGKKFRARSALNVVDELELVQHKYGFNDFVVIDDTFTQNIDRAKDICREILARKVNYTWHCFNGIRADRLDEELLDLMKESGCKDIWFGVESLVPDVFNLIRKGETTEDVINAINMTNRKNIRVSSFFIIGLPGSTYKKDMETLRQAKGLGILSTHWGLANPIPGTALWDWVKKNGKVLRDYRMVTTFIDPEPAFETADYTETERLKMFYKANLAFYNHRDLMRKVDIGNIFKVLKIILKYDPLRLPLHLLIGFGKLAGRLRGR